MDQRERVGEHSFQFGRVAMLDRLIEAPPLRRLPVRQRWPCPPVFAALQASPPRQEPHRSCVDPTRSRVVVVSSAAPVIESAWNLPLQSCCAPNGGVRKLTLDIFLHRNMIFLCLAPPRRRTRSTPSPSRVVET